MQRIYNDEYVKNEIERCFDFPVKKCEFLDSGYDCEAYLINYKWLFKITRYEEGINKFRKEKLVLDYLKDNFISKVKVPKVDFYDECEDYAMALLEAETGNEDLIYVRKNQQWYIMGCEDKLLYPIVEWGERNPNRFWYYNNHLDRIAYQLKHNLETDGRFANPELGMQGYIDLPIRPEPIRQENNHIEMRFGNQGLITTVPNPVNIYQSFEI